MSRKQTVSQLFAKFASEETEIRARVEELSAELETLNARLAEVEVIRAALETANESTTRRTTRQATTRKPKKAAAKKPAAKKPAAKKAPAKKPAATKPAAKKSTRKGRRKTASGVHSMGIVEAAIFLAKKNGVTEADAGDVLGWFKSAGYKTRTGTPTRNSVYVSLNREAGTKRDTPRVTRPAKGRFQFHD